MSRRQEADLSLQADKMIREPWAEIPYFFTEYWGTFATAICVSPAIPPEMQAALVRRLELDGSYFVYRTLTPEAGAHFEHWLDQLLPSVWGDKADIARIALMLQVPPSLLLEPQGIQRARLARRFPCPILFHFAPHDPWRDWITQHHILFGATVELYPAQAGQEELAVP